MDGSSDGAPHRGPGSGLRMGRVAAVVGLGAALVTALWHQRDTVGGALGHLTRLDGWTVLVLVALAVGDRIVRGVTMRRAVGARSPVHGVVLHDVGAAASYGLPGGGLVGAGMRFRVASGAGIPVADFLAGVTAFGVAMSFAAWLLPAMVLGVELALFDGGPLDAALFGVSVAVLGAVAAFWTIILRSDRTFGRIVHAVEGLHRRAARRSSRLAAVEPRRGMLALRARMRACVPRLPWLFAGALAAQLVAAAVLYVSLLGLGAGPELGVIEFARVFFVTRVLSTLVPTPGGVGVVEAGLTGALVAAGVASVPAVGAVLLYRLATFVLPIVTGTACWFLWCRVDRPGAGSAEPPPSPAASSRATRVSPG